MRTLGRTIHLAYAAQLRGSDVPFHRHNHYLRWLTFFLDFHQKYHATTPEPDCVGPFLQKLRSKQQTEPAVREAAHAVELWLQGPAGPPAPQNAPTAQDAPLSPLPTSDGPVLQTRVPANAARDAEPVHSHVPEGMAAATLEEMAPPESPRPEKQRPHPPTETSVLMVSSDSVVASDAMDSMDSMDSVDSVKSMVSSGSMVSTVVSDDTAPPADHGVPFPGPDAFQPREDSLQVSPVSPDPSPHRSDAPEPPSALSWQKAYELVCAAVQTRQYSDHTRTAYLRWIRQFAEFLPGMEPSDLSTVDVRSFLTDLAVQKRVSPATQNQAFNALLFFFRTALHKDFGPLSGVPRPGRKGRTPYVMSREQLEKIFGAMEPMHALLARLLYGCGLRLHEGLRLRLRDLDLDGAHLNVLDAKGRLDRTIPLPRRLLPALREQHRTSTLLHQEDVASGTGGVFLPPGMEGQNSPMAKDVAWQWLFPARDLTRVPESGVRKRSHLPASHLQKALAEASRASAFPRPCTVHTLRHSFANHLLRANQDIRTLQELLGLPDVKSTLLYTHALGSPPIREARSPLDL